MLTEEWHHMFVGGTGVMRIIQRTCEVMRELQTDNPERLRAAGVIDLPTMQRFLNFHYSVSLDLFGQELSTNGATYFTTGLKGRYHETRIADDHRLSNATWPVSVPQASAIVREEQPALLAINERLRDDYIVDCQRGLNRWNKEIEKHGVDMVLTLPHRAPPGSRRLSLSRGAAVGRAALPCVAGPVHRGSGVLDAHPQQPAPQGHGERDCSAGPSRLLQR